MQIRYGSQIIDVDSETTTQSYSQVPVGGADSCTCSTCRNWVAIRDHVFPTHFLTLLDRLGIDYRKDAEVVHYFRREDGLHLYGGWYHCIGELVDSEVPSPAVNGASGSFEAGLRISDGRDLVHAELRGHPLVAVEFMGYFSWEGSKDEEPE